MVARLPLEEKIGVRVPDRQQNENPLVKAVFSFFVTGNEQTSLLVSGTRKTFLWFVYKPRKVPATVGREKCIHSP